MSDSGDDEQDESRTRRRARAVGAAGDNTVSSSSSSYSDWGEGGWGDEEWGEGWWGGEGIWTTDEEQVPGPDANEWGPPGAPGSGRHPPGAPGSGMRETSGDDPSLSATLERDDKYVAHDPKAGAVAGDEVSGSTVLVGPNPSKRGDSKEGGSSSHRKDPIPEG